MIAQTFSTVDYAVFAVMLAISFAIGIYYAFKSANNNEVAPLFWTFTHDVIIKCITDPF